MWWGWPAKYAESGLSFLRDPLRAIRKTQSEHEHATSWYGTDEDHACRGSPEKLSGDRMSLRMWLLVMTHVFRPPVAGQDAFFALTGKAGLTSCVRLIHKLYTLYEIRADLPSNPLRPLFASGTCPLRTRTTSHPLPWMGRQQRPCGTRQQPLRIPRRSGLAYRLSRLPHAWIARGSCPAIPEKLQWLGRDLRSDGVGQTGKPRSLSGHLR